MTNDLWGAAVHESGHAIAVLHYRQLGYHLTLAGKCWINGWGDGGGGANVIRKEESALPTEVRLAITYAGGAAQNYFDAHTSSPRALKDDEAHADKFTAHMQAAQRSAAKEMDRYLPPRLSLTMKAKLDGWRWS